MDSCSAFDVALAVLMQRTPYSLPNSGGIKILKEVRTEINQARGMESYHERKKAGENIDKPLEELNPIDDKTFSAVVAKMLAPVVKVAPKIGVEEDDSFTPAPDEYY